MKQIVDNFDEGKVIPKCQFSVKAVIQDGEVVPPLLHQATLLGTKPPDNIITFDITPPPIVGMYTYFIDLKHTNNDIFFLRAKPCL